MNELTTRLRKISPGVVVDTSLYLGERVGVAGHTIGYVTDAWVDNDWIMLKVGVAEPKE